MSVLRKTSRRLADGREIVYFDDTPDVPERTAVDSRDLPEVTAASEIRRDPLTDEWVAMAAHRQTRTYKPPADLCPLCPSSPGTPSEVPESDYDVVVFENRFPSFSQGVDDPGEGTVDGAGIVPSAPGRGRCEVVCFTSDHTGSFGRLAPERVRTVVDVWADRTAALSELDGVRQVFPFENRGEEIGVTLSHPHGQIYGYPFVTPRTERMLATAEAYRDRYGRHVLGDVLAAERASGERVVAEGEHWTAFVPPAARWPVQVQVVPHRQVADLTELTEAERDDFARVYLQVLGRCDGLYGKPLPYVAGWYQAPQGTDRNLSWLHLELLSVLRSADKLKYLAGSESGMAVWINDATPEQIARRLRAVGDVDHGTGAAG
ncbi:MULTISPECIES: galactose-1-phosphate uridylyltransferase [Prauserella salsuginis group]|uniref:Galactose-1-phosphate uridylyltransferase n=2 Tax=Prauserella salsuginis group TaxID=2893672 RepID=A0A839XLG1_9PSEU|nr:UDPglucose--hexose-1-phosphate uridylyltransferase [Prauserella sediminis]MCR3722637.1 UDPglucose--hexose-1-phosphate uridylyltransferase [Prauserella flava]MCR3737079.1 UDPglucose--hexose-1-phosphate uridylyltransferase [Prauserella salsuginis]